MKTTLLLLALAVLAAPALASRELKQIGFGVCSGALLKACCTNFKFGKITQLKDGKAWPEKTECKFNVTLPTPVGIRPIDKPLKTKEDVHELIDTNYVNTTVNLVTKYDWILVKYEPPNNLWADKEGDFCVCPSPGVAINPATTLSVIVAPDEPTAAENAAGPEAGLSGTKPSP